MNSGGDCRGKTARKPKIILPILSHNFWLRTSVDEKYFCLLLLRLTKVKAPAAGAEEVG